MEHVDYEDYIRLRDKYWRLRNELLWVWTEVWPLVHGLTSRDTVRERFKKLPELINL